MNRRPNSSSNKKVVTKAPFSLEPHPFYLSNCPWSALTKCSLSAPSSIIIGFTITFSWTTHALNRSLSLMKKSQRARRFFEIISGGFCNRYSESCQVRNHKYFHFSLPIPIGPTSFNNILLECLSFDFLVNDNQRRRLMDANNVPRNWKSVDIWIGEIYFRLVRWHRGTAATWHKLTTCYQALPCRRSSETCSNQINLHFWKCGIQSISWRKLNSPTHVHSPEKSHTQISTKILFTESSSTHFDSAYAW